MPTTQIGRTPAGQIVAETPLETPSTTPGTWWGSRLTLGDPGRRYGTLVSTRNVPRGVKVEMLNDPVIAFTLGYIATVLSRARYRIECADPIKKRFFEAMYAAIHREFILQAAPAIALGSLGLIKKFEFAVPSPIEVNDPPVWTSETVPYIITGFDQIAPYGSYPTFDEDGHFTGIERISGLKVDAFYALWLTRGKELAFGSYWGKGREDNCYRHWWVKQFAADLFVIHLQKNIDRAVIVEHPEGGIEEADGEIAKSYRQIAKETGDAIRSGATVTLPSAVYETIDMSSEERLTTIKKWAVSLLEGTQSVGAFHDIEDHIDQKISLGMLVPPQVYQNVRQSALGGPTTSDVLGKIAERLLLIDAVSLDLHLNKYAFPIVERANFPPDSPPVRKVTFALADEDTALLREIIRVLMGRPDVDVSKFDMGEAMTRLGMPIAEKEGVTVTEPTEETATAIALSHAPEIVAMTCPLCSHDEVDRYADHGGLCVCRACGCTFDPEVERWPTTS